MKKVKLIILISKVTPLNILNYKHYREKDSVGAGVRGKRRKYPSSMLMFYTSVIRGQDNHQVRFIFSAPPPLCSALSPA